MATAPLYVFADGGCVGNGGRAPRAAFAAVLAGGPLVGELTLSGPVGNAAYEWGTDGRLAPSGGMVAPSNNRAELLAIIVGLGAALALAGDSRVEVVSDSLIAVRTLDEWLPARRRLGTESALANFDLVAAAERLLVRARARGPVVLTHVAGHAPAPAPGAPARARLLHAGNDAADRAASAAIATRMPAASAVASSPADAKLAARVCELAPLDIAMQCV